MKRMRYVLTVVVLIAAAATAVADQPFVGYRNDGTGVYPEDCDPVAEWNQWAYKPAKVPHKGRMVDTEVPDGENPVNIVWRKELHQWCNGGMVVADGKLFLQADRGGMGYAREIVPDFVGNKLICVDPATGDVLWERDLHHLDKLPPAEAREVEADIREANRFYVETFKAFLKYRKIAGPLVGGGHGQPDYSETMPGGYEAKYEAAAKEFAEVWADVPRTVGELRERVAKKKGPDAIDNRQLTWNYQQLAFKRFLKTYFPEKYEQRSKLSKYGYAWCAWYGMWSFVGAGIQTPVSDGEHIYVHTGYNDVFCYDLEGNRKWVTWFGPMGDHHGTCLGSPVLVGNVLVINGGGDKSLPNETYVRGLDKRTGEVLWTSTDHWTGKSYTRITPVPLTLPVGDTGETLDVVWTGPGNVFRVADGEVLATKLGCHGNGRHVGVDRERNIIVLDNGASEGGAGSPATYDPGTVAIRLVAESRNKVKAELLWHDKRGPNRLVVKGDNLYGFTKKGLEVRDLMTGEVLAKAGLPRGERGPHHTSLIAGDYLYAMQTDGDCLVYDIRGEKPRLAAKNRLGHGAKHEWWEGAQPFFSGNRIFIRGFTELYCIGNPEEPTRLSEAHK